MKNTKFYFLSKDSEVCYPLEYVKMLMDLNGLVSLDIYPAVMSKVPNMFWCKHYELIGDKTEDSCGKRCNHYQPKNGKSGCCVHYSNRMYEPADEPITINLTNPLPC